MLTPGTYLQNRYEILEQIGSGGMSVVYKVRCHTLNRLVAIKVLKEEFASDESFVGKFKMEAQAAARLSHPNIVSIYDVVDEGALHYIVMELMEGITLKHYIEKKGSLENQEATGIAIQVASGIAAAHAQHIVHRDIKPQNILISRDGKVKVADFGIARAVSSQTVNAMAVGSVHYISPEQARGGYCDERSDIYSFGITLYEMMTGSLPFDGDNTVTVALAHLEEPVVPPSQYNPEIWHGLEQIILKCTQKRPDMRYQTMEDVISDLRSVLVDSEYDIEEEPAEDSEDLDNTRPLRPIPVPSRRRKQPGEERKGKREDPREDVSTQFERIIAGIGLVAAILIVAVVLFVFSRLSGLFWPGTGGLGQTTQAVTEIVESQTVEVTLADNQVYMPSVLGLSVELAQDKLKSSKLELNVISEEYSDNYAQGQVMSQEIAEGTIVNKWSSVNVTVSKGSDRVVLSGLGLEQKPYSQAKEVLEENELAVTKKEEASDLVPKGSVIRVTPAEAKHGETVTVIVSSGPKTVEGQVPKLTGMDAVTADALLSGAGLTTGNVTYESSDTVAEGLIISQSVLPGTILEPQTPVDYVVSGQTQETQAQEGYYVSSIDTTCSLSNFIGPASKTSSIRVLVRLKQQDLNGDDVYTTLISPRLVVGAQEIPVVISRIKGIYGVDSGTVEVVDADTMTVIASYPVTFFPAG